MTELNKNGDARGMSEISRKNLAKGVKISEETAREYQEKSSAAQKENTKARKEIESFQISSNKALAPIQASSLKELAQKANDILHDPEASPSEIKLAIEILTFLRDSSGQKPTDKQEVIADVKAAYKLDTNVLKKAIDDIDNLANDE